MTRWPQLTAGVDEVGRGPLAGPVVAAAVILPPGVTIGGLDDSKKLSPRRRVELAAVIKKQTVWSVARAEVVEIDTINILHASLLAMQRAVAQLPQTPALALVDGNRGPDLECPMETIVGGDALEPAISAASILAKVYRDQEMAAMETQYPGYGFAANKGYPTRFHLTALGRLGPCPIHRRSFQPVRSALQQISLPLESAG